jgi:hypothetical protein
MVKDNGGVEEMKYLKEGIIADSVGRTAAESPLPPPLDEA